MEKKARSSYPISDLLARRWSPRAFVADKIPGKEVILSILEAARWAPSAFNEQPWRFLIAPKDDREEFDAMLSCLVPANAAWCVNACLLIVGLAATKFTHNGRENAWCEFDLGLAVENLLLEATSKGLFAHPMAGFMPQRVIELYKVPEEYKPVVMIALGYPAQPASLADEKLRLAEAAPRERRQIFEFTYRRTWGDNKGV